MQFRKLTNSLLAIVIAVAVFGISSTSLASERSRNWGKKARGAYEDSKREAKDFTEGWKDGGGSSGGPIGPISLAMIGLLTIDSQRRRRKKGNLPGESSDENQPPAPSAA